MGMFDLLGNIGTGVMGIVTGRRMSKYGTQMLNEGQALSDRYQRPEMVTPQAINMMMSGLYGRQYQNLPGYQVMQNTIGQSTASAINALKEMGIGSEGLGAAANVYANEMKSKQALGIQNAQYQDVNQMQYLNALPQQANWEQMAWKWNEADPYLQAQRKAMMLETMGRQAQWEGMKTKMGSWAEMFNGVGGALDATLNPLSTLFPQSGVANILSGLTGGVAGG